MSSTPSKLGAALKGIRARRGWTLKEMSEHSGIPVSTLSKVEHDRLTLTYDKLYQLAQRLGMRMSELFAEVDEGSPPSVTARRSVGDVEHAVRVETPNYDYYFLCPELRRKRMIPVVTRMRAKSLEQFGALLKHGGEEYIYVLRGRVVVNTEFYDPVVLEEGGSFYLDASMGHAYFAAEGCDEAIVLGVMSGDEGELMTSLVAQHEEQRKAPPREPATAAAKKRSAPRAAPAPGRRHRS